MRTNPTPTDDHESGGGARHSRRVFDVLAACHSLDGDDFGPTEIGRATGIPAPTVYRILRAGLADNTFTQSARGRYRLGKKAAALAARPRPVVNTALIQPYLDDLHQATAGGLVAIYELTGPFPPRRIASVMALGDLDPDDIGLSAVDIITVSRSLRTGASGRALLAHLPDPIRAEVFSEPVPPAAGPGVITDNDALAESLEAVRSSGYAIGRQECMPGWDSVAAPIWWGDSIHASLLLLKQVGRLPTDQAALTPFITNTVGTADAISKLISSSTSPTPPTVTLTVIHDQPRDPA